MRACERVNPIGRYGVPWTRLTDEQQHELVAFDDFRCAEEARHHSDALTYISDTVAACLGVKKKG